MVALDCSRVCSQAENLTCFFIQSGVGQLDPCPCLLILLSLTGRLSPLLVHMTIGRGGDRADSAR